MTLSQTLVFQISDLTLDVDQGRLTGPAGDVALRPKSFALLCHFARHAGRVLSKDELIATVWPDVTVTDDSLTQCVCDVRKTLGEAGAGLLRTIPRRGYLFDLPVPIRAQVAPPAPSYAAEPHFALSVALRAEEASP